jgi:hypothetical protein
LAPGASGADGADGAREQRTGDAGSSCSEIQCAPRIRRREEHCRRLRDVVAEPCRICRLGHLRVRHVRRKHQRVGFHRRVCASESVSCATAIHAKLTLGHVRVLKHLYLRGRAHRCPLPSLHVCISTQCGGRMHLADLRPLTRTRTPPARTGPLAQRSSTYACEPTHTPAISGTGTGASSWPARMSASARTPGDGGERVRTRVFRGYGLHKLRRGRGRKQPACANARVRKRAGHERRIHTSDSEIEGIVPPSGASR